nr:SMC-Scp complex subunit ScpB [Actinophytocola xanthii]
MPTEVAEPSEGADLEPEAPVTEVDADEPADADPPTEVVESGEAAAVETVVPGTDLVEPGEDAAVESDVPATESDLAPADADPPTEVVGEAPDTVSEPADPAADQAEGAEEELPELTDEELENTLEALLLVVDSPVEEEALAGATDTTVARVRETVLRMAAEYAERGRGLDLRHAGGGWRFYTRDRYAPYVEKLLLGGQRAKLTRAALETLAVIAYRQPVTRARVAAVRGVNCDGVIRTLLARGLVEETGTDTETGGFLYRTTELFLERLGLSSLDDLPPIAPLLPEVDSIDDV